MGKEKGVAPSKQAKLDKYTKISPSHTSGSSGPSKSQPPQTASASQILLAIGDLRNSIEGKIDELKSDLSLIRYDLRKTVERVTEAETKISTTEDEVSPLKTQVAQLLRKTAIL